MARSVSFISSAFALEASRIALQGEVQEPIFPSGSFARPSEKVEGIQTFRSQTRWTWTSDRQIFSVWANNRTFRSTSSKTIRFRDHGARSSDFLSGDKHKFSRHVKTSNVHARAVFIIVSEVGLPQTLLGKQKLKVLVLGSGGREHALCKAIKISRFCDEVFCIPGNAGIAQDATCIQSVSNTDVDGVVAFCKNNEIDFVVVGPEAPLVAGVVNGLEDASLPVFGPSKEAAILEGSKAFMKDFLKRHKIPTAAYGKFTDSEPAKAFVRANGCPIVIKTDGLAAGKGVIIAQTEEQAFEAIDSMLNDKSFGSAGDEIVIEEFLEGEEASFFAVTDGTSAIPLASAQDHKRVGDGDTGPNTGGMGAYSPAPMVTNAVEAAVMQDMIIPTVRGMAAEGRPYKGVLFAGLMMSKSGEAKLLEYNVRFGDPECQALCMRLDSDLLPLLVAAATGALADSSAVPQPMVQWSAEASLCVVMAANGYPAAYVKGTPIRGLNAAAALDHVQVYHGGTELARIDGEEHVIATGGRVLSVCSRGSSIRDAQAKAYAAVDRIEWPGGFCRRDIGWRAVLPSPAHTPPSASL